MYQTVMLLLITAVVTIITTIITVRVTMTGRVISQDAKAKFTARAKRYGWVAFNFAGCLWSIYWLIHYSNSDEPITRKTIILLSIWVAAGVVWVGVLIGSILDLLFRKSPK